MQHNNIDWDQLQQFRKCPNVLKIFFCNTYTYECYEQILFEIIKINDKIETVKVCDMELVPLLEESAVMLAVYTDIKILHESNNYCEWINAEIRGDSDYFMMIAADHIVKCDKCKSRKRCPGFPCRSSFGYTPFIRSEP